MSNAVLHVPLSTEGAIIRALIARAGDAHGVGVKEILSRYKGSNVQRARRAAMRLVRAEFPGMSWPQLGRVFGRHHSSVMYACGALVSRQPKD